MKGQIFLIISFFYIFIGCDTPAGHNGISQDIKESKKRKVFISEYIVEPNPYKINDTLQITVKEAWIERQWAYGSNHDETILYPTDDFQLCINTTENDIKDIGQIWTIGISGDKYIRVSGPNSLVGDFQSLPTDSIEYKVQRGRKLSSNSKKIIVGKLKLFKKI